jgi:hypothetical protein
MHNLLTNVIYHQCYAHFTHKTQEELGQLTFKTITLAPFILNANFFSKWWCLRIYLPVTQTAIHDLNHGIYDTVYLHILKAWYVFSELCTSIAICQKWKKIEISFLKKGEFDKEETLKKLNMALLVKNSAHQFYTCHFPISSNMTNCLFPFVIF